MINAPDALPNLRQAPAIAREQATLCRDALSAFPWTGIPKSQLGHCPARIAR
jgi:hypothetical protein